VHETENTTLVLPLLFVQPARWPTASSTGY